MAEREVDEAVVEAAFGRPVGKFVFVLVGPRVFFRAGEVWIEA